MKPYVQWGAAAIALASVLGVGAAMSVAQDKEAIVKERQAAMKQEGDDLRAIKGYIDGTGTDQAVAIQKAQELIATADKMPLLFPTGTSSKDLPGKTSAKPDIWEQRDKYDAAEAARKTAAQNLLSALQKGDKTAAQAAFSEVGKTCGACHGPFREKT